MSSRALNFYQELPSFGEFSGITEDTPFVDVPEGWWVVLTDVRGSTQAIRDGRYDEINMIGAAAITCVMNLLGTSEFPFVFGGDGATLLIPEAALTDVKSELQKLRDHCRREFRLELRVGFVAIAEIRRRGLMLQIGKLELSPGNYLAQFRGEGLTVAEALVKSADPAAEILGDVDHSTAPNLEGLSCRVSPFPSRNGVVLSLLVKPTTSGLESQKTVVREVLASLRSILETDLNASSPVDADRVAWKWLPRNFFAETRLRASRLTGVVPRLREFLWILVQNASLKFNIPLGPFKPRLYKQELVQNSDFRKFDETLRMIVDCRPEQADAIERRLEALRQSGDMVYGVHRSRQAIMTCVVLAPSQNRHVHFVDGGDGGYAMAAVQMKKMMSTQGR